MNYEFYFLKDTGPEQPEILRVMAPSLERAAAIVARQYGWSVAAEHCSRVSEFIAAIDIHPIDIQNIFEGSLSSTNLR